MQRFDIDLASRWDNAKLTVFGVQAEDVEKAKDAALGFMAKPHRWHVTGTDLSPARDEAGDN